MNCQRNRSSASAIAYSLDYVSVAKNLTEYEIGNAIWSSNDVVSDCVSDCDDDSSDVDYAGGLNCVRCYVIDVVHCDSPSRS